MTQKFGRNYRLTIYPRDGSEPILITMPLTLQMHVARNQSADQNIMELKVYNLAEQNRNAIYQDWFDLAPLNNSADPITGLPLDGNNIILEAGYDNLIRIFLGYIWKASSARENGGVDMVTRISAFGNNTDLLTTQTFQTLHPGQTLGDVLQFLIGQFPNLKQGNELNYPMVFNRPVVLNGLTWDLLKKYSNGNVYIDNGKIYILRPTEVLNSTFLLNASTGLLGTPRREFGALYVEMLFEPTINVGMEIDLQSIVQPSYNGKYVVNGVTHTGIISDAVGGNLVTVLELLAPNTFNGFTTVKQL